MIRFWLTFIIIAVLIHFGITAIRKMNSLEKWTLTKSIAYSIIVSLLAIVAMMFIVVLF